jgi:cell fate regulator YaaT (PSP1 superfamily)
MSCSSCGTKEAPGCQNNGHCSTGGCNKLNVFDWLSNMDMPALHRFEITEIRFKNGRKGFYRNDKKLDIVTGDPVVVDVPGGHHIGYVSLQGELVRLQMTKKGIADNDEIKEIYRKASGRDLERWEETKNREPSVLYRTKEIIQERKMEMKLTDVEYQADGTKATFYYSADDRVDFRELIKILASEFRIRIEMRQINLREEAGRIGGVGVCGRELCCSTWLSDFKAVSTQAARYQNLSLNPSKLSGQCGRLKCCLNYELDTYMEALKDIPELNNPLKTERGLAVLQKTDIFRKIMWFGYEDDNNWYSVNVKRVKEILNLNEKGIKPATLLDDKALDSKLDNTDINSDLEAMDKKYNKKGKRKSNRKKKNKKNRNFQKSTNRND